MDFTIGGLSSFWCCCETLIGWARCSIVVDNNCKQQQIASCKLQSCKRKELANWKERRRRTDGFGADSVAAKKRNEKKTAVTSAWFLRVHCFVCWRVKENFAEAKRGIFLVGHEQRIVWFVNCESRWNYWRHLIRLTDWVDECYRWWNQLVGLWYSTCKKK